MKNKLAAETVIIAPNYYACYLPFVLRMFLHTVTTVPTENVAATSSSATSKDSISLSQNRRQYASTLTLAGTLRAAHV